MLITSILLSLQAVGDSCSLLRLDKVGVMRHIPISDQDGGGLCASYVGAAMADAVRFARGDKDYSHLTSPLATAAFISVWSSKGLGKHIKINRNALHNVLRGLPKFGSCSKKAVRDEFGQYKLNSFLGELKDIYNMKDKRFTVSKLQCITARPSIFDLNLSYSEVLTALKQNTYEKYLKSLFKKICKGNTKKIQNLHSNRTLGLNISSTKKRLKAFKNVIQKNLKNKKSLPIGINYCKKVLYDPKSIGVRRDGNFKASCKYGKHSSMIVGRRRYHSRCQVLVRNTYGTSCNSYYDRNMCDRGQIWIDIDDLTKNLVSTFTVKVRK